jgi:hypothetical protein
MQFVSQQDESANAGVGLSNMRDGDVTVSAIMLE